MELQVGTEYQVNHSRKGTFTAVLRSVNGEWAELEITHGRARAMCSYNEPEAGERVTVRRTLRKSARFNAMSSRNQCIGWWMKAND